ncbi:MULTISPECIES: hypothetical protein [Acidobacteriaceae]|uniref:hypothetical protein n=1 Tax=Acidobacteriaceae TaxID=204434 RepID=UPI00131BAFDD|nr:MULTISPECIES: hypothetical protein [Acidobacteriaceae]MDW5267588.1 hypothetical protein [Edaphobacter sp.]
MSQIIWTWLKDGNPNSGVNFRPLPKGDWDGVAWDGQHHRCSNNVPFGGPPVSPTAYEFIPPITWSISATKDNPANIFFDVEIDEPDTDLTILKNQNVAMQVGSANKWATTKGLGKQLDICSFHGYSLALYVALIYEFTVFRFNT